MAYEIAAQFNSSSDLTEPIQEPVGAQFGPEAAEIEDFEVTSEVDATPTFKTYNIHASKCVFVNRK